MPIDQMLVIITRVPLEGKAVKQCPGLTQGASRSPAAVSAEVDLFFDWNSDMILTLQRIDAVGCPHAGGIATDGQRFEDPPPHVSLHFRFLATA